MNRIAIIAAAFAMTASMGLAQSVSDSVVADLQAQGYTNIEVKTRANSVKIEGVKDGQKIEITLDKSTGAIIKQETESADSSSSSSTDDSSDDSGDDSSDSSNDDGPGHDVGDDHGGDSGHGGGDNSGPGSDD